MKSGKLITSLLFVNEIFSSNEVTVKDIAKNVQKYGVGFVYFDGPEIIENMDEYKTLKTELENKEQEYRNWQKLTQTNLQNAVKELQDLKEDSSTKQSKIAAKEGEINVLMQKAEADDNSKRLELDSIQKTGLSKILEKKNNIIIQICDEIANIIKSETKKEFYYVEGRDITNVVVNKRISDELDVTNLVIKKLTGNTKTVKKQKNRGRKR